MVFQQTPGRDESAPIPGAGSEGRTPGPDGGAPVWIAGALAGFEAEASDASGMVTRAPRGRASRADAKKRGEHHASAAKRHGGKALWERWQELWNGDLAIADEIIAPGFVAHLAPAGDGPNEVRGPEALKRWIAGSLADFADYGFTSATGPLARNNMVVGRWVFRAVYRGGMPGAHPGVAESAGGRVERAGVDIFRVESGRIAEYCPCADVLQTPREGGAVPEEVPLPTKP